MSTVMPLPTSPVRRSTGRVRAAGGAILASLAVAWWAHGCPPLHAGAPRLSAQAATFAYLAILVCACGALVLMARRRSPAPPADPRARAAVARALSRWADNPIAAHALAPDKAYYADAEGIGGVAFRVCAGVALAAGGPIGPEERRLAIASGFVHHCRARGWLPAFYQTLDREADTYRPLGMQALKIGEEAMIDLPAFSLAGSRIANVRHCVTHCERAGLRAELYLRGVEDEATLDGLDAVSEAWLRARAGRGEMGFSMGDFSREAMRSTCVALARDREGRICAFVTFRPLGCGERTIMVLDLMRRDDRAPSGTIDFLIARALEGFRDAGYRRASLSLAPLAGVDGDGRQPRVERLLRALYERGNGVYRYKSLYSFKRKFAPRWEPRYLVYPSGLWNLLRVGLAVGLVHMPRVRKPAWRSVLHALAGGLRQSLDWRRGLEAPHLDFNLRLMTIATLVFALPELSAAIHLLGQPHIARGYGVLAMALALGDTSGALALARRLDLGRRLLATAAVGFFVKAAWGLAAAYEAGAISWIVDLALAPVEIWVIWFLLQPEVRSYMQARSAADRAKGFERAR